MPPAGCAWKGATRHARPARGRALLRAHLRGAFQHDAHAAAGARVVPVGQALQRAHLALEAHAACARRPGSAPPAPVPQRPPARSQNAQRALLGRRARSQGHVRVPRPSRHCLAAACACAPAAAHTATRRSARLALPSPAHVSTTSSSKQARRTEGPRVRVCNALSAHNSRSNIGARR